MFLVLCLLLFLCGVCIHEHVDSRGQPWVSSASHLGLKPWPVRLCWLCWLAGKPCEPSPLPYDHRRRPPFSICSVMWVLRIELGSSRLYAKHLPPLSYLLTSQQVVLGCYLIFYGSSPGWPGTHHVSQASLKHTAILPQVPECWGYRHASLQQAVLYYCLSCHRRPTTPCFPSCKKRDTNRERCQASTLKVSDAIVYVPEFPL